MVLLTSSLERPLQILTDELRQEVPEDQLFFAFLAGVPGTTAAHQPLEVNSRGT